jgi:hypothetical protein
MVTVSLQLNRDTMKIGAGSSKRLLPDAAGVQVLNKGAFPK